MFLVDGTPETAHFRREGGLISSVDFVSDARQRSVPRLSD